MVRSGSHGLRPHSLSTVSTLRSFAILIGIATVGAALTAWLHPEPPPWERPVPDGAISAATLAGWLSADPPPLVLDARPATEFNAGSVPGAIHFPEDDYETGLMRLIEAWSPGRRVVVFCGAQSCELSRHLALRLQGDLGDPGIVYLDGGWEAWLSH
jgi:rhodanese-related sulfurtransferase